MTSSQKNLRRTGTHTVAAVAGALFLQMILSGTLSFPVPRNVVTATQLKKELAEGMTAHKDAEREETNRLVLLLERRLTERLNRMETRLIDQIKELR